MPLENEMLLTADGSWAGGHSRSDLFCLIALLNVIMDEHATPLGDYGHKAGHKHTAARMHNTKFTIARLNA